MIRVAVAALVVLSLGSSARSCYTLTRERDAHEATFQAYRADSAKWARQDATLRRALAALQRDAVTLNQNLHKARQDARQGAERLRGMLATTPDTGAALGALRAVLTEGEACGLALANCEARAGLERRRADAATAGRLRADSQAVAGRAWALAEIRHAKRWNPLGLKPPSLVWLAGTFLAGGWLLR